MNYRNLKPETRTTIFALCRICKKIANNQKLVKKGGAKCFPNNILVLLESYLKGDCSNLPRPNAFDSNTPDAAIIGVSKDGTSIKWLSMVFFSVNFLSFYENLAFLHYL